MGFQPASEIIERIGSSPGEISQHHKEVTAERSDKYNTCHWDSKALRWGAGTAQPRLWKYMERGVLCGAPHRCLFAKPFTAQKGGFGRCYNLLTTTSSAGCACPSSQLFFLNSHPVVPGKIWHRSSNISWTCGRKACLSRAAERILRPSMSARSEHYQTGKTASGQGGSPAWALEKNPDRSGCVFNNRNVYSHRSSLPQFHGDWLPLSSLLVFRSPRCKGSEVAGFDLGLFRVCVVGFFVVG